MADFAVSVTHGVGFVKVRLDHRGGYIERVGLKDLDDLPNTGSVLDSPFLRFRPVNSVQEFSYGYDTQPKRLLLSPAYELIYS